MHFRGLLSKETVAYLLKGVDATFSTPSYCQAHQLKKLVLGHNCNKYIITFLRLGSTREYLVLSFCIDPPYGRADTASLELFPVLPSHFGYGPEGDRPGNFTSWCMAQTLHICHGEGFFSTLYEGQTLEESHTY